MAYDKLVDSTQLDSDLTSVANAIRAKSGGSSQLAFPAGFVSEINSIGGSLPAEYQEVEYIQTSGTQYIDTALPPTVISILEVDYQLLALPGTVFGAAKRSGGTIQDYNYLSALASSSYTGFFVQFGNGSRSYFNSSFPKDTNRHLFKLDCDAKKLTIDDTEMSITSSFSVYNNSIFIFSVAGTGDNSNIATAKLYRFKHKTKGGGIVQDMIPCYEKQSNTVGLFDVISQTFFTNDGTGTFTAGPDVLKDAEALEILMGGAT